MVSMKLGIPALRVQVESVSPTITSAVTMKPRSIKLKHSLGAFAKTEVRSK